METLSIIGWAVGGIGWGVALFRSVQVTDLRAEIGAVNAEYRSLRSASASSEASDDRAFEDAAAADRKMAGESAELLRQAVEEAKEQEGRAMRYFEVIERIEKERDRWSELYHDASRKYLVGQNMMMREIHRLARRANVEPAPVFRQMIDEYTGAHPGAVRSTDSAKDGPALPG